MPGSVLKANAKDALRGNWGLAILTLLIEWVLISVSTSVAGIGELIFIGPLSTGVALIFLKLSYQDKAEISDLFIPFQNFVNTFFAGLLVTLFIFLWSLLFVVPGIVKGLAYSQTFYIMNEHPEYTGKEAIDASQELMQGHKGELFLLQLSFIGWYFLCVLTLGLLLFYLAPYYEATMAEFHRYLLEEQNTIDDNYG